MQFEKYRATLSEDDRATLLEEEQIRLSLGLCIDWKGVEALESFDTIIGTNPEQHTII